MEDLQRQGTVWSSKEATGLDAIKHFRGNLIKYVISTSRPHDRGGKSTKVTSVLILESSPSVDFSQKLF